MNFIAGRLKCDGGRQRLCRGDWSISLDGVHVGELDGQAQDVVLGIRPQHVAIGESGEADHGELGVKGVVRLVEMLGDATVATVEVHTRASDAGRQGLGDEIDPAEVLQLTVKADARSRVCVGDRVRVKFDAQRACLFDPRTGVNLARGDEILTESGLN